jgi:amino acid adenylation domain-containing protein
VLYTSGSTGRPKGVALAHRPLVNLLEWQLEVSGPAASGRTIQYAPLSFDPSFLEMFSAWASGGTLVLLEEELRRDFLALVRHLDRERIGRIYITPAALHQLADASDTLGVTPRALREINAAGERLEITPQIARMCARIGDCVVFNQYGPTESHVVTAERLAGQVEEWPVLPSIGPALPNTRMHLLDAAGEPQPIGVAGELFIAGECLARGYVNNPRLTAERFLPDPWPTTPGSRLYRTGDLARLRADGAIEYLGRTDHQVKLRGYRIELGEIESVLTQHPGVLDAVAAVRESAAGGRHLAAYIVARGTTMPSPDVLRAHVAAALPEYMVPALFQRIDGVPLTPSGKVDRASLPALDDTSWPDEAFVAPTTAIEHAVAAIWSDTLGVPRVGVHDNFFTLGGHSLLAAQVVSRARREWGVEVPIRVLFEQPTVAAFADRVQTLVWASKGQALAGTLADREEGVL